MYSSGFGVEKDEIKGFELYKKHANELAISRLYLDGYISTKYEYRNARNYVESIPLSIKLPDSEKNNPNRYKIAFDYYESFYKDYKQKERVFTVEFPRACQAQPSHITIETRKRPRPHIHTRWGCRDSRPTFDRRW